MSLASIKKEKQKRDRHLDGILLTYRARVDRGDLEIDNYDFSVFEEKEESSKLFIKKYIKTKIKPKGFDI